SALGRGATCAEVLRGRAGLGDAVLDAAAPASVLETAALDVLFEVMHAALHALAQDPERIADILDRAVGLVSHHESHACSVSADRLETHRARVGRVARNAF